MSDSKLSLGHEQLSLQLLQLTPPHQPQPQEKQEPMAICSTILCATLGTRDLSV